MVRITEELVRKKSEHNECEITTLEELSLHQEDIEKIEHLHNWCRDLQILLLQSNLISKIDLLWVPQAKANIANKYLKKRMRENEKLLFHSAIFYLITLAEIQKIYTEFISYSLDPRNVPKMKDKYIYTQSYLSTENLWKLKKLNYLNLALNNIERIENLEKLESLEKLDLTLNFIGELSSVQNLKENYNLKYLYLTGNPCTDYRGYREYVITVLPQLKQLDSVDIERSEVIVANQDFEDCQNSILREQEKYFALRIKEKSEHGNVLLEADDGSEEDMSEEQIKAFWNTPSRNTPEDRIEIARKARKIRDVDRKRSTKAEKRNPPRLFTSDGRPLNINQARIPLTLTDDTDSGCIILDVAVYRYLDTSLIQVDLHPKYVTMTIKGMILQITFEEEIKVDKSICQRSQTTGHLLLKMPKENPVIIPKKSKEPENLTNSKNVPPVINCSFQSRREYLEIGPASREMDFSNIANVSKKPGNDKRNQKGIIREKMPSPGFVDNSDVPPLE